MTPLQTEPMRADWTTAPLVDEASAPGATTVTALDVNGLLARLEVSDLDVTFVAPLAIAAAELAELAGIAWRPSTDDPAVAMVRLIAKIAVRDPGVGGPHTAHLAERLRTLAA
jgi:hypothetical protein